MSFSLSLDSLKVARQKALRSLSGSFKNQPLTKEVVLLEGWLSKKGESNTAEFRKRFFRLYTSGSIRYFVTEMGDHSLGSIDMTEAFGTRSPSLDARARDCKHSMDILTPSRTWVLISESDVEIKKWKKAIEPYMIKKTSESDIVLCNRISTAEEILVFEGCMCKKGHWNTHDYKKRYFRLFVTGKLKYYDPGGEKLGEIDLMQSRDIRSPSADLKSRTISTHSFDIITPSRTWFLLQETLEEHDAWSRLILPFIKLARGSGQMGYTAGGPKRNMKLVSEGWLQKRGMDSTLVSPLRNRYFRLFSDGSLKYYTKNENKPPQGEIDLKTAYHIVSPSLSDISKSFPYSVDIVTPNRVWVLVSTTADKLTMWIRQIRMFTRELPPYPVKKEGFLHKQGLVKKNWKKRFFILGEKCLIYFASSQDSKRFRCRGAFPSISKKFLHIYAKGFVNLDQANDISMVPSIDKFHHCFAVTTSQRRYYIAGENDENAQTWFEAIKQEIIAKHIDNPMKVIPLKDSVKDRLKSAEDILNSVFQTKNSGESKKSETDQNRTEPNTFDHPDIAISTGVAKLRERQKKLAEKKKKADKEKSKEKRRSIFETFFHHEKKKSIFKPVQKKEKHKTKDTILETLAETHDLPSYPQPKSQPPSPRDTNTSVLSSPFNSMSMDSSQPKNVFDSATSIEPLLIQTPNKKKGRIKMLQDHAGVRASDSFDTDSIDEQEIDIDISSDDDHVFSEFTYDCEQDDDDIEEGCVFKIHTKEKNKHIIEKKIYVDMEKSALNYGNVPISLRTITSVLTGKVTDVFKNNKVVDESLCFSILSSEKNLNIECRSKKQRDYWVGALTDLLKVKF